MEQNQTNELSPHTAGFGLSASVTIVFNTVLTWAKETYDPLNAVMKALLGHHWITHGVAVVAVFLVLGFFFSKSAYIQKVKGSTLVVILVGSVVLSGLGIAGFFLLA